MTKIKICGLKRKADILYVNKLRPEYVGFIFASSKRKVSMEKAKQLISGLHPSIKKIGVFYNEDIETVKLISKQCNLDVIQLHGDEDNDYIDNFDKEVWKAIRVKDKNSIKDIDNCKADKILLDTFCENTLGGSGEAFNWKLLKDVDTAKIIMAGGINQDNVKEVLKKYMPYCIDVSSSVEENQVKSFEKIKKIIYIIKEENRYEQQRKVL